MKFVWIWHTLYSGGVFRIYKIFIKKVSYGAGVTFRGTLRRTVWCNSPQAGFLSSWIIYLEMNTKKKKSSSFKVFFCFKKCVLDAKNSIFYTFKKIKTLWTMNFSSSWYTSRDKWSMSSESQPGVNCIIQFFAKYLWRPHQHQNWLFL